MINNKDFKTINGLMSYLRDKGINIQGSRQKKQLINYGYYHGYKGYRFYKSPNRKISYTDFKDIVMILEYDRTMKELFYSKLMFIETALKNLSIEPILNDAGTNKINVIFDKSLPGRNAAPVNASSDTKKKLEMKKQKVVHKVRGTILNNYNHSNNIISNFYNKPTYSDVPIWAVFEVITLGEFGNFVSNLSYDLRDTISKKLELDLSGDTNRMLLSDIIFVIQDLRNAVAHNDIVYDTRFRKTDIRNPLKTCMKHEIGFPYANFDSLIDYVALVAYLLKKMDASKREILGFINEFENKTNHLVRDLPTNISSMVVHADTMKKVVLLKAFVSN